VNLGRVVLRGEVVGVVVLRDQLPGSSCSYQRVKKINSGPKANNSKRTAIKSQKRANTSLAWSLIF
jgi:hypothetical protein